MNETTSGALSRRQLLEAAGTAAAAVAAASLAGSVAAATPTQMPFQAKMEGQLSHFNFLAIPVRPLIRSAHEMAAGTSALVGQFQWASRLLFRPNIDDTAAAGTDGIGAMTAANGDALFFAFSGSTRGGTGPGLVAGDFDFTITGGSGKFCGAAGSGTFHDDVDFNKGTLVRTMNGVILMPG